MNMQNANATNDNATDNEQSAQKKTSHSTPPLQFGLSTLLWLMVAVGLIFGTLRWMQVPATTSLIVMAILVVCGLAVVLLVAAISKVEDDE
ncbi:MAG: hypothetical protein ABSG67_16760 [Thermoguttaceae bacterium]|jgi:Flp pilus assembly protein TadB